MADQLALVDAAGTATHTLDDSGNATHAGTVTAAGFAGPLTGAASSALALMSDDFVRAAVACANGASVNTALLTVTLTQRDGTTALSSARQVLLTSSTTQYGGEGPPNASLSLGTVTAGSIIATLSTSNWLIQTDATGLFAATATNTDDEAIYFAVVSPKGGVSDIEKACVVLGSNVDLATWTA